MEDGGSREFLLIPWWETKAPASPVRERVSVPMALDEGSATLRPRLLCNILHIMADDLDHALRTLADNLRYHRAQRAWTQDDLAQASGVSRRMIAALEAARNNVSLSTLDHLAQALSLTFAELVSPRLSAGTGQVQRGITLWTSSHLGSQAVLVNTAPARQGTELWHWRLGPGDHYVAAPDPQGMTELLYVLHGELTVEFTDRQVRLEAGDSLTYPSDQPYTYRNTGPAPTGFIRNVTH